MNKIIHPLQPKMTGRDIANLQSALKMLQEKGFFGIRDRKQIEKIERHWNEEVSNSIYGKATYELVRLVQDKYDHWHSVACLCNGFNRSITVRNKGRWF